MPGTETLNKQLRPQALCWFNKSIKQALPGGWGDTPRWLRQAAQLQRGSSGPLRSRASCRLQATLGSGSQATALVQLWEVPGPRNFPEAEAVPCRSIRSLLLSQQEFRSLWTNGFLLTDMEACSSFCFFFPTGIKNSETEPVQRIRKAVCVF